MFDKDTFIVPYSPGDQVVYLKDVNDYVVYKIFPFNVLVSYVQESKVLVKSRGTDNQLDLLFSDGNEATEALTRFQSHLDSVKNELRP